MKNGPENFEIQPTAESGCHPLPLREIDSVRPLSKKALIRFSVGCVLALPNLQSVAAAVEKNETGDPAFVRLATEKHALARRLATQHHTEFPAIVSRFFDAANKGDWQAASNYFYEIEQATPRRTAHPTVPIEIWGPIHDVFGAFEQFHTWDGRLLHRYGDEIIKSIPAGSIYFGGTDAGRFVVTALSSSHTEGRPFFTLTQNALADGSYLDYLRDIYSPRIYVPTTEDFQQSFNEYLIGAEERFKAGQLKEHEEVKNMGDRIQVTGIVAVMEINNLLVQKVIKSNPTREIFLEESYPLESLYAQSLPHGLIFQILHKKLEHIPPEAMDADRKFWAAQCNSLLGTSITNQGGLRETCAWVDKVFLHSDTQLFKGDTNFLKDAQAPQYFSLCRKAVAEYYDWWSKNEASAQAEGLAQEAGVAHCQAFGLSPYNPIVAWSYAQFLLRHQRTNDAKLLIHTVLSLKPEKRMVLDSDQLKSSMEKLTGQAKRF
jgi:hypothetical protein